MAVLNINAQSALVISSKFMSSKYIVACKVCDTILQIGISSNSDVLLDGRFTTASAASTHQPRKLNRVEANEGNLKFNLDIISKRGLKRRFHASLFPELCKH
ncbi:conserved hypothetical protein [Coccidioides posadasii str. Silveira]|uniref:Uncharacterized protein n=2 Tax=Coccidioides posadasii TaxID=199306 RepID=E9D2X0_COCPS|nr:conserved hypothetical protein [Coccidioides posadasii str. Silveira]KMM71992.1 hypothetical protein CPAG_08292 [Coccidioides posadasii RMSCC 3488]